MEFLLAFFTCFAFQISNFYIANIIFVCFFIFKCIQSSKLKVRNNLKWFFMFMGTVVVSTTIYALTIGDFAMRNAIQLIYNIMYVFLAVEVKMDYSKFRCYYVTFSRMLSAFICILFVILVASNGVKLMADRQWAEAYIPGWPNGTGLVLIFAYYLLCKYNYGLRDKVLVGIAMVLTTSRLVLLGLFIITLYFEVLLKTGRQRYAKKMLSIVAIGFACLLVVWYVVTKSTEELDLVYMFTRTWDRMEIINVSLEYVARRPLLGYGGNTLDEIVKQFGALSNLTLNWPHSHSTLFELLLRYGIIGTLTFLGLAFAGIKYIKGKENRFIYVFLWGCSLIQIYFRSFPFLMMLIYLLNSYDEPQITDKQYRSRTVEQEDIKCM